MAPEEIAAVLYLASDLKGRHDVRISSVGCGTEGVECITRNRYELVLGSFFFGLIWNSSKGDFFYHLNYRRRAPVNLCRASRVAHSLSQDAGHSCCPADLKSERSEIQELDH